MLLFSQVIEGSLGAGFKSEKGFKLESDGFGELVMSKEANSLMGLFNGQTVCKKNHIGTPQRPAQ